MPARRAQSDRFLSTDESITASAACGWLACARAAYLANGAGVDLAGERVRLRRGDSCPGISAALVDYGPGLAADGALLRPARVDRLPPLGASDRPPLPGSALSEVTTRFRSLWGSAIPIAAPAVRSGV